MDDPTLTGLFNYDPNLVPRNVFVNDTNMDGNTLVLTWLPPISPVVGYRIYRSFWYDQQMTPIGATSDLIFIDSGVEQKRSYYYRVVSLF